MQHKFLIALLVGIAAPVAFPAPAAASTSAGGSVIPRSETRTVKSSINGVTYELQIFLPRGYESAGSHYSVLYVLDGLGMGPEVAAVTRSLYANHDIPPVIVVGIDTKNGEEDRYLDMPTIEPDQRWPIPANRGAANFLRVVTEEIKPFVDTTYRTDPADSGIGGHSLGGFFSLYALLHAPEVFHHDWISSPSMIWSHAVILKHEEALAQHATDLPARVFADVGGMEDQYMIRKLIELTRAIGGRRYPSLRWQMRVVEGENHATVARSVLTDAMYAIYGPSPRTPDAAELASLTGNYSVSNGSTLRLETENGRLFMVYPDRGYERVELSSSMPDHWFVRPDQIGLTVQRRNGAVTSITIGSEAGYGPGDEKAKPPLTAVPAT